MKFLTRKEAAQYLADRGLTVSPNTLQKYATTGGGPVYQIFGNRAVYTADNLNDWVEQKMSTPRATSA